MFILVIIKLKSLSSLVKYLHQNFTHVKCRQLTYPVTLESSGALRSWVAFVTFRTRQAFHSGESLLSFLSKQARKSRRTLQRDGITFLLVLFRKSTSHTYYNIYRCTCPRSLFGETFGIAVGGRGAVTLGVAGNQLIVAAYGSSRFAPARQAIRLWVKFLKGTITNK